MYNDFLDWLLTHLQDNDLLFDLLFVFTLSGGGTQGRKSRCDTTKSSRRLYGK
jgi:hypothetical protein